MTDEGTRYRALFQSAPIAMIEVDASALAPFFASWAGSSPDDVEAWFREDPQRLRRIRASLRIVDANRAALRLYGVPARGDVVGRRVEDASIAGVDLMGRAFAWLATGAETVTLEGNGTGPDGGPLHLVLSLALLREGDGGGWRIIVCVADMTSRKRAEQELRRLSERLVTVRDAEARRLSRRVHDDLGQLVTAIKIEAERVRLRLRDDQEDARRCAGSLQAMADEALETVRAIARDIRPPRRDDMPFADAVHQYVESFAARTGLRCAATVAPDDLSVGDGCADALMGILREALTNVVRHAHATAATVRVEREGAALRLTIEDDGRGVPRGALASPDALGVVGMRERAAARGGTFAIEPAPAGGTRVAVCLPCAEAGR